MHITMPALRMDLVRAAGVAVLLQAGLWGCKSEQEKCIEHKAEQLSQRVDLMYTRQEILEMAKAYCQPRESVEQRAEQQALREREAAARMSQLHMEIEEANSNLLDLLQQKEQMQAALAGATDERRAAMQSNLEDIEKRVGAAQAVLRSLKDKARGTTRDVPDGERLANPSKCDPNDPLCGI